MLKSFACAVLLALAPISSASAQSTAVQDGARTAQPAETQKSVETKALALLDAVIEDSRTLRLAENRVRLQSEAADILWPHDERRARSLFLEAINNFSEIMGDTDAETQDESLLQAAAEAREELLAALAKHDASLAREFLRGVGKTLQSEDEIELNLRLATEVAAYDPRTASQMAEESLLKGFSYQLPELILQLQKKNHAAAAELVGSILNSLRGADIATDRNAAYIAQELLRMEMERRANSSRKPESNTMPIVNEQGVRALVEMLAATIARAPASNAELLTVLQSNLPEVRKYAPSLAPRLRQKASEAPHLSKEVEDKLAGEKDEGDTPARPGSMSSGKHALPYSNEERAALLVEEAHDNAVAGDSKRALQQLAEARALVGSQVRNSAQLHVQLRTVQAYAALDSGQSFEILESLLDQLNSLADAVLLADGFINEEQLTRDDEFILWPLYASIEGFREDDAGRLSELAHVDFERIRSAADRLQRPEIRALAHLLIAQSILCDDAAVTQQ
jgi:hypothetical protein